MMDPRFAHLSDPAERRWLTEVAPADVLRNAHRIYDFMAECGIATDSVPRELAFEKAAEDLGIDYNVLYDAWLSETPAPAVDADEQPPGEPGEVRPLYVITIDGEEIDHADTLALARRARDTIIYGGIGTLQNTAIVPRGKRRPT